METGRKEMALFLPPYHILSYSEEENGGDWNSFMALKHSINSEDAFSKNKCANDGQDLLTVHAHSIDEEDAAPGSCF